ncbi:MAG TPA: hypothetical protein DCY59_04315 [Micrococcaceae bacterium]|nr:hypothetical protein [Micrococcaceae bacterium]
MPNSTPLTRGQALSPAQWSQPNEGVPQAYRLVRRRADNIIVNADIGEIDGTQPVVDLDWSYFRGHTDQWLYVHALRAQGFEDRYRISKLSIDLLQLLTSDRPLDKQQAGKLLTLEPGDPIYLSGDWPGVFRGIYFAEGITETINSNTWQIDLEISNFRETVGQVSPEIPAKIWDSASYPWQDEFRKWNEA